MSSFESTPPPGWSSPPPPPHGQQPAEVAPPPQRRPIAWLLVAVIVFLPAAISYIRAADLHPSSYALGTAFGTVFVIAVVAAAARAVHHRISGRAEPAPPQAFVAVVAVLAIGVQYVIRNAEGKSSAEQAATMMRECRESDPSAFGALPSGMRVDPLPPATLASFQQGAGATLPPGISPDVMATGQIVDGSGPRAMVVGIPGVGAASDSDKQAFMRNVFAGAGITPTEQVIGGVPVLSGRSPAASIAVGQNGCWVDMVIVPGGGDAAPLAAPILRG